MSLYNDIELLCTNAKAASTSLALASTEEKKKFAKFMSLYKKGLAVEKLATEVL